MTVPQVQLTFNEPLFGGPNVEPAQVIEQGLISARAVMVAEAKRRIAISPEEYATDVAVRRLLDACWGVFAPRFSSLIVPMIAAEYGVAFSKVEEGHVDLRVINELAQNHAKRMGEYFHTTSADALVQGFNTYVNRKVPARIALNRALNAYGLTPRQMNGLTSLRDEEPKKTSIPQNLERRVTQYIDRSLRQRFKVFSGQEEHNLDNQAQQVAWLWMRDKGLIPETSEKVWHTAEDERVCPVCGPLHGQTVRVSEPFVTESGVKYWVPGAHVNCRCWVTLHEPLSKSAATLTRVQWKEDLHPRDKDGQFRAKPVRARNGVLVPVHISAEQLERMWDTKAEPVSEGVSAGMTVSSYTPEQMQSVTMAPQITVAEPITVAQIDALLDTGVTPEMVDKTSTEVDAVTETRQKYGYSFDTPAEFRVARANEDEAPDTTIFSSGQSKFNVGEPDDLKDWLTTNSLRILSENVDATLYPAFHHEGSSSGLVDAEIGMVPIYGPEGTVAYLTPDQAHQLMMSYMTQTPIHEDDWSGVAWYDEGDEAARYGTSTHPVHDPDLGLPTNAEEWTDYFMDHSIVKPDDLVVDVHMIDPDEIDETEGTTGTFHRTHTVEAHQEDEEDRPWLRFNMWERDADVY